MITSTRFVTFYSYKGGVGRSLALANVAFSLAGQGKKVLIIDMDFEAPGQHMTELFVRRGADRTDLKDWPGKGMLEWLEAWRQHPNDSQTSFDIDVRPYLRRSRQEVIETLEAPARKRAEKGDASAEEKVGEIWLMASGNSADPTYPSRVAQFDWENFSKQGGGSLLDGLRYTLAQDGFDYVLLDTRTGYSSEFLVAGTDIADTIIILTSYNRQNIEGTRDIIQRLDYFNAQRRAVDDQYLAKRVMLLGSPQPTGLGTETMARRYADIRLQWPELVEFALHLPYDAELALEERIRTRECFENSRLSTVYAERIERLCGLIAAPAPPELLLKPLVAQNPFEHLRGGNIDSDDVVKYFVDPGGNIVADLEGFTPLVITGARGTGKTMLARRFCIDEWLVERVAQNRAESLDGLKQIGLYFHIDSDVLHSFNHNDDSERKLNDRLFGFFFDILLVRKALGALQLLRPLDYWGSSGKLWHSLYAELGEPQPAEPTLALFLELLEVRLTQIRLYLNNPKRFQPPVISAPNILFKRLVEYLKSGKQFSKLYFVIHIDEYENFEFYQQRILNTRLKHARFEECVTYRFYMRSGGFATRETLAIDQVIENINDFRQHSLDEELDFDTFRKHAVRVANRHLKLTPWFSSNAHTNIATLFEDFPAEEEAQQLVQGKRKGVLEKWIEEKHPVAKTLMLAWFQEEPSYLRRAVGVVMLNQGKKADDVVNGMRANDQRARDWYHNYSRGALHWLCRLHHIDKRYAGLDTLIGLAGNNIRVFIDYCYESFSSWLAEWESKTPTLPISVKIQNDAIHLQAKILRQNLYSAPRSGPEINRFLDRFGRLCEAVHKSPKQSEPEINHFSIKGKDTPEALLKLLRDARFEGVVRQLPGNKQKSLEDERQENWQLSPWICPLFNLSSRRKKKMTLTDQELNLLFNGSDDDWLRLWRAKEAALDVVDDPQAGLFE